MIEIRRADPSDAASLVALAQAVGAEEGRWILATESWRSVSDERRYLKTVLRHPDATVIVAVEGEDAVGPVSYTHLTLPTKRIV